jgi:predicted O-methyltransferase YrrM
MLHKLFKARSYRKVASIFAERSRAANDADAVRAAFPWIDGVHAGPERAALAVEHARYCREVSSEKMAADLGFSTFLQLWCLANKPKRVVDLGSGFTSYVLRRYAKAAAAAGQPCEVWSVDDHAEWLGRTREYLAEMGQDGSRVMVWGEFIKAAPHDFDLVVHDAGSMQFRADNLGAALDLARSGGLVLLDDVHRFDYRAHALELLAQRGYKFLSVRALRDAYGRYPYAVFKP